MIETKKSAKADLERGWLQRFLLGLVVAVAALVVALETSIEPDDPLDDPDLLSLLEGDEELPPLMRPENELQLAPKAEPQPTVKLKVTTDDDLATPEELERQPEQAMEGEPADELPEADEQEDKNEEPEVAETVDDLPQFPGGQLEFIKWLTRNLKYPAAAQARRVQGRVVAEFIVNKDGSITDVRIVRSLSPPCDGEAMRVLRMMPRWTAGAIDGHPCRTKVCIPIVFRM
jgi:protein TonB